MNIQDSLSTAYPQVRKSLLQLIFSGAYLLRWNDKLRPRDLLEIDKQGHKMIVATLLWDKMSRELSAEKRATLARELIEGALFDYFYRLVVTDIKPPIFYQIKNNREQYKKLTEHVFRELQPTLVPLGSFWERFKTWHTKPETHLTARRILDAAHMFASQWEFRLIEPMNGFDQEMPAIAANFTKELNALRDSSSMRKAPCTASPVSADSSAFWCAGRKPPAFLPRTCSGTCSRWPPSPTFSV